MPKQHKPFIPSVWSKKILEEFSRSMIFEKIFDVQALWDTLKLEHGVTDKMRVTEAEHIPDHIKKMIDKVPESEGQVAGLNFIYARHWDEFKSTLLLCGATVTPDHDITVPVGMGAVTIGTRKAVNVADLNTFFGIVNGTFNHPSRKKYT